ncbi:unnamed protein product [Mycena citricolor]|uniref:CipC protein n=1 Tax=Mycena citricolor TaxID=2018698 RepID=A0AAD2Q754_9AGAR|nr:unnamed protein product [Mycena citricolor]CAK5283763.1 unnamed protein product [Mycena citricolor]
MGFFSEDSKAGQAWAAFNEPTTHKGDISHELLAGAASFVAAREYEKHCAANGKPSSHAEAKALLAGFAGAFIDKEVESRGLDFVDKEKAKKHAHEHISETVDVEGY